MTNKTLYVSPVPHSSVQGRGEYSFVSSSGNRIPMGRQFARGVRVPLGFVDDPQRPGYLKTGLDRQVENPYYGQELEKVPPSLQPGNHWVDRYEELASRKEISLQTLFEIMDNVPEGHYTSAKAMPDMASSLGNAAAMKDPKSNYLETFKVFLEEGQNPIGSDTSYGRLAQQVVLNHPQVASSRGEINQDLHRFYIGAKDEETLITNHKRRRVQKAMAKLGNVLEKYDFAHQYQLALILKVVKAPGVAPATVENLLSNYVWEQGKTNQGTQDERLTEFLKQYELMEKDPDRFYVRYLIRAARADNVLRIVKGKGDYIWSSKKGNEGLYNLGRGMDKIENMFYNEMQIYDPALDEDNAFHDLEQEMQSRGALTRALT